MADEEKGRNVDDQGRADDQGRKQQELAETDPHSERLSETPSRQQKAEREREATLEKPEGGDGRKPTELRSTSRSDMDKTIEKKEGRQTQRTPEEMSLHEELSRTKDDGKS